MPEIKTLKNQVYWCLENYPSSRNSDIDLMIAVWQKFYPQYIKVGTLGQQGIWLQDLHFLPREDNIKRVRAFWQNTKGVLLPTDPEVAKKRNILEEKWRESMRPSNLFY